MADLTRSPHPRRRGAGRVVDDLSQDERLASLSGRPAGPRPCAGRDAVDRRTQMLSSTGRWCWTMAAPIDRRIDAALAMAADPAGAQLLIQLAAQNKVAYQLREAVGSVIFSNPDRSVRSAAAGFFARPGGQPRMTVADVSRPTGRCRHAARTASWPPARPAIVAAPRRPGAEVGPDLDRHRRQVRSRRADRCDRESERGDRLRLRRGAVRDAEERADHRVPPVRRRNHLDSRRLRPGANHRRATISRARLPLKTSLMPDPLALALTEQDVADIVTFLMGAPLMDV